MDKSYITFNVQPTSKTNFLGLEVLLDNSTVYNNELLNNSELIQIELPEDENAHSLKIVLKNKKPEHTVIDYLGAIVQDSNVIISDIKIDDIALGHNVLQSAVYTHDCNGTDQLKEYKFYGEMGCNGTVELKFSTPVYLWLLENM
jgi:hypothetical protein